MDKYLKYIGLSVFIFSSFLLFFSCENEKKQVIENTIPIYHLEIDSTNAKEFAQKFIDDLYNSDGLNKKNYNLYNSIDSIGVSLLSILDLYTILSEKTKTGSLIDFVKYDFETEKHKVIIRVFTPPQEVDFYEIFLDVKENEIVITDYLSYVNGVYVSEIINEIKSSNLSKEKLANTSLYIDSINDAFNNFDVDLAAIYFNSIDSTSRKLKLVSLFKLGLDIHSSNRNITFRNQIHKLEKGSNSYWLNSFYYFVEIERYPKARLSLMNLRERVGEDAILSYLEGITYFEEKNYAKAVELYTNALSISNQIPDIHFAKIICLIEKNEYTQAVESLLVMEDYFAVTNINWDKEFMGYPDFLISDEYSRWLERVGAIEDGLL